MHHLHYGNHVRGCIRVYDAMMKINHFQSECLILHYCKHVSSCIRVQDVMMYFTHMKSRDHEETIQNRDVNVDFTSTVSESLNLSYIFYLRYSVKFIKFTSIILNFEPKN